VLWSGRVADPAARDPATEGIREFNRRLFARPEFRSVILPLRDGVAVARREE
jgi:predicted O-methyltransferase YrrM